MVIAVPRRGIDFHVGGGVLPGGNLWGAISDRILRETVINLDFHVGNVRQGGADQAGHGRSGEHGGLVQDKVIRRLRLQFVDACRARQRSQLAVGVSGIYQHLRFLRCGVCRKEHRP